MHMPREWDAQTYDAIPLPHVRWGARTLDLLDLAGNERVLDAGCGTGRVTEQLLERLPHGQVVALDGSQAMLAQLRVRMAPELERVEVVYADLMEPLPNIRAVDGVFSTATFHWIPDHERLFRNLATIIQPGGWLVAECGGAGNVATVNAVLEELGYDQAQIWNFADAERTRDRLTAAGFTAVRTWLTPDPVPLPAGEPLETYLATVVLGAQLDALPEERRTGFVREVAQRLPRPEVDYVRLTMVARRPD
jgi:trans-aconitate 2-methyltransferase